MTTASKTTSITIRFNNGEISEGLKALTQFCELILSNQQRTVDESAVTDFISGMATLHKSDACEWVEKWIEYKEKAMAR